MPSMIELHLQARRNQFLPVYVPPAPELSVYAEGIYADDVYPIDPTLKQAAGSRVVGSAADREEIDTDWGEGWGNPYNLDGRLAIERDFDVICPTDYHWPGMEATQGVFTPTFAVYVRDFCVSKGVLLHPHAFHDGEATGWPLPAWIADAVTDATTAEAVLRSFLANTIPVVAPNSYMITAVGEPLADGLTSTVVGPGGVNLREGVFGRLLGTAQFDIVFDEIRQRAPGVPLILNDYQLELHVPRMDAMFTVVSDLHTRGVMVAGDGVGIECHATPWFTYDFQEMVDFVRAVHGLGLRCHLTEVDINDGPNLPADIPARDAAMADFLEDLLDLYLPEPGMHSCSFWGFADRHDYVADRGDGLPARGKLYDRETREKPMVRAARAALARHAPGA